jgi:hypothetical protein
MKKVQKNQKASSLVFQYFEIKVARLYSLRPFQRAIVELCLRQNSKVIETTDGQKTKRDIKRFLFKNALKICI